MSDPHTPADRAIHIQHLYLRQEISKKHYEQVGPKWLEHLFNPPGPWTFLCVWLILFLQNFVCFYVYGIECVQVVYFGVNLKVLDMP